MNESAVLLQTVAAALNMAFMLLFDRLPAWLLFPFGFVTMVFSFLAVRKSFRDFLDKNRKPKSK